MLYTIVYQNTCGALGVISWLGSTFTSYQEAVECAKRVCESLKDDMPCMTFFVLMHQFEWISCYEKR